MKKLGTLLSGIKNFGPVTSAEFKAMGLTYLEQLEELGFEDVCRLWVERFPERLNANAFLGVICTLDNTVWTKATPAQRAIAHNLVGRMRKESGLPPAKRKKRSRI